MAVGKYQKLFKIPIVILPWYLNLGFILFLGTDMFHLLCFGPDHTVTESLWCCYFWNNPVPLKSVSNVKFFLAWLLGASTDGEQFELLTYSAAHVPLDQLVPFSCAEVLPDLPRFLIFGHQSYKDIGWALSQFLMCMKFFPNAASHSYLRCSLALKTALSLILCWEDDCRSRPSFSLGRSLRCSFRRTQVLRSQSSLSIVPPARGSGSPALGKPCLGLVLLRGWLSNFFGCNLQ